MEVQDGDEVTIMSGCVSSTATPSASEEVQADGTEDQIVRFVARNLKLGTASGRFLLYHYVEGDSYQLPLLNVEVTLKVAGDAYPPLLRLMKAPRIIITVERSRVTIVEPSRILRPMPRYELRREERGCAFSVTSEASIAEAVHERLRSLPYYGTHTVKRRDWRTGQDVEEVHEVTPDRSLSIRPESCGCCARVEIKDVHRCPVCGRPSTFHGRRIFAYWLLFRSNLPYGREFMHSLRDDVVTVYDEDRKKVVSRSVEEVVRDVMRPSRPFKEVSS